MNTMKHKQTFFVIYLFFKDKLQKKDSKKGYCRKKRIKDKKRIPKKRIKPKNKIKKHQKMEYVHKKDIAARRTGVAGCQIELGMASINLVEYMSAIPYQILRHANK